MAEAIDGWGRVKEGGLKRGDQGGGVKTLTEVVAGGGKERQRCGQDRPECGRGRS
jgi:hypothetical protein